MEEESGKAEAGESRETQEGETIKKKHMANMAIDRPQKSDLKVKSIRLTDQEMLVNSPLKKKKIRKVVAGFLELTNK